MNERRFHQYSHTTTSIRRDRTQAVNAHRRFVFLLLGGIACVGWMYLLFVSDLLNVRTVLANPLKTLDEIEIAKEVYLVLDSRGGWRPWSTRHRFFINTTALEKTLQEHLFAERVTVDRFSYSVLRLKIEERAKRVVLHSHQQYVWVDLSGMVTAFLTVDEKRDAQARLLGSRLTRSDDAPLVHLDMDRELKIGDSIVFGDDVKLWIRSASQIMKEGVLYRDMIPPDSPSSTTAILTSSQGFPVLVDLAESLIPQIRSYRTFMEQAGQGLVVTSYVDARIPGKVYVK